MQIDPRHLIQLATIVEKESFTEAALVLNISQPALSKTIGALEKRLGAPVLSQRRPVIATPLGERLAEQGRLIQASVGKATQSVVDWKGGLRGRIRLGAPPFFLETIASDVVLEFNRNHPDVAFEFVAGYFDEVRNLVLQRRLDLALGPMNAAINAPSLDTRLQIMARKALFCRIGHPLLEKENVTASELSSASWVGHSPNSVIAGEMKTELFELGVTKLDLVAASASVSLILSLVEATDFLSYLPLFMASRAVREGRLAVLRVDGFAPETPFGLIQGGATTADPLIRAFADTIGHHLAAAQNEVFAAFPHLGGPGLPPETMPNP